MTRRTHAPRALAALACAAVAAGSSAVAAAQSLARPRCRGAPGAFAVDLGARGAVSALAAARDGDRLVVAARVLPPPGARRGRTEIVAGELGRDGAWVVAPRVVASMDGRVEGAVEVVARDGARRIAAQTARGVVLAGTAPEAPVEELGPPARGLLAAPPLIAPGGDALALVWRRVSGALVQRVPVAASAARAEPVAVRLPDRTMLVSVAAGDAGELAAIARTPGRRYVVVSVEPAGRARWTGNGAGGCDGSRCAPVSLQRAPGGYLASWWNRPTVDELLQPAGRAIDARGRARGRESSFIPMERAAVVPGPGGHPLALHLGRPVVVRGGERPVAIPPPRARIAELPSVARAWVSDELGPGIEVVWATRGGALVYGALACEGPSARATAQRQ